MATQPLPVAPPAYSQANEQTTRRSVEQIIQDTNGKIDRSVSKEDKLSSLSLRRFQFLLMGASNG
jgi:hypothetical protein